jgi:hypothetical protein
MARKASGIPYLIVICIVIATILLNFTISKILTRIRNYWTKKVDYEE